MGIMRTVAIVENNDDQFDAVKHSSNGLRPREKYAFKCVRFRDAVSFLQCYKPIYDIVFMDIGLPSMNGFATTRKLRETNATVLSMFITNMREFAVNGYGVGAFDFVVKHSGHDTNHVYLR